MIPCWIIIVILLLLLVLVPKLLFGLIRLVLFLIILGAVIIGILVMLGVVHLAFIKDVVLMGGMV